jgi:uncharacterized protein YbjT (DUF2867 family)
MNVLVIGSTGGSGRAAIDALVAAGHSVRAFARSAAGLGDLAARVEVVEGDVLDADAVQRAVRGQDAVVVALGIRENALAVRLRGSARTAMNVRSAGTANVVAAMRAAGVRRLVVQSSYGVGPTRARLTPGWRLIFALVLSPQIADTEAQEAVVRTSGLEWVLVQPVGLNDRAGDERVEVSAEGQVKTMRISRTSVGRFLAQAVASQQFVGGTVALSAA